MYGGFLVPAGRRRRAPGRAVLAQGRVLHRLRARHDRPRRVGGRHRPGRGPRRRQRGRRHRRAVGPGHRPGAPRRRSHGGRRLRQRAQLRRWPATSRWPPPAARSPSPWRTAARSTPASTPPPSGCRWTRREYQELIALGREIKWALNDTEHAAHPTDPRLSGVYGTILHEDLGDDDGQVRQRNVTVFADGAGRPLALRLGHLRAAGRPRRPGPGRCRRPDAAPRVDRRVALHRRRRGDDHGRRPAGRRTAGHRPGAPHRASTPSSSTPPTRSCRASCCDERTR